jgi:hypothetical protein
MGAPPEPIRFNYQGALRPGPQGARAFVEHDGFGKAESRISGDMLSVAASMTPRQAQCTNQHSAWTGIRFTFRCVALTIVRCDVFAALAKQQRKRAVKPRKRKGSRQGALSA